MAHVFSYPHDAPTPTLPRLSTLTIRHQEQFSTSSIDDMANSRNNSTCSSSYNDDSSSSPTSQPSPQPVVRTRSVAWGTSVVFERAPSAAPPSDDDVIMVTVRLSNAFRRGSRQGSDDLPNRPPARSFLRRLSTRLNIDHAAEKEDRYKAVKMPRREYKRYFRRDAQGNYAGSEPERDWDEEQLMTTYAEFQNVPPAIPMFA